jgi:hypothetical protein
LACARGAREARHPARLPDRRRRLRDGFSQDGNVFMFDFTGMAPLPEDDAERNFLVLLDEFDNFRHHPEILDRLSIEVDVRFRDDDE